MFVVGADLSVHGAIWHMWPATTTAALLKDREQLVFSEEEKKRVSDTWEAPEAQRLNQISELSSRCMVHKARHSKPPGESLAANSRLMKRSCLDGMTEKDAGVSGAIGACKPITNMQVV